MQERFPTVFKRGGLETFSYKERLIIRVADVAFCIAIAAIGRTLRIEQPDIEQWKAVADSGKRPILALWHDRIFAGVYYLRDRNIAVLTSKSMDGEYIARFLTRFGFGAVRGSSSRGGVRALVEMIKLLKQGVPMAFTVDGPRGPRYEVKSGPVILAKRSGEPIVPFLIECKSYWQVKSWDRLHIPKPFSKAKVFYAEPMLVPEDADDEAVEQARLALQRSLDDLVKRGEEWRNG